MEICLTIAIILILLHQRFALFQKILEFVVATWKGGTLTFNLVIAKILVTLDAVEIRIIFLLKKCEQTCGQNSNQISSDYQPNYWSNNNAQVQEERPDWGQMEALNLVNNIQDPILVNAAQDLSSSNDNNNQDT